MIAAKLVNAIDFLHSKHISHNAIRIQNVIFNRITKHVTITELQFAIFYPNITKSREGKMENFRLDWRLFRTLLHDLTSIFFQKNSLTERYEDIREFPEPYSTIILSLLNIGADIEGVDCKALRDLGITQDS